MKLIATYFEDPRGVRLLKRVIKKYFELLGIVIIHKGTDLLGKEVIKRFYFVPVLVNI